MKVDRTWVNINTAETSDEIAKLDYRTVSDNYETLGRLHYKTHNGWNKKRTIYVA